MSLLVMKLFKSMKNLIGRLWKWVTDPFPRFYFILFVLLLYNLACAVGLPLIASFLIKSTEWVQLILLSSIVNIYMFVVIIFVWLILRLATGGFRICKELFGKSHKKSVKHEN